MEIQEMTVRECRDMLARNHVARLACALDNQPYIVPIHVAFDGLVLYGYSTLGQKIEWMRQNPLVCLEMDAVVSERQWESVVVFGNYEELTPTPEFESARLEAERLFQQRAMWWEPAAVSVSGRAQRPRIVFRIHLHGLTGRRAVPDVARIEEPVTQGSAVIRPRSPVRASRGFSWKRRPRKDT